MYYDSTSEAHNAQTINAFVTLRDYFGGVSKGACAFLGQRFQSAYKLFIDTTKEKITEPDFVGWSKEEFDEYIGLAYWGAGVCARTLGDWGHAGWCWLQGTKACPYMLDNWTDAACAYEHFNEHEKIIELLDSAPEEIREAKKTKRIKAMSMVALGDYQQGTKLLYDGLVQSLPRKSTGKHLPLVSPGMDLTGKKILIYGASGRGDGIQHCRSLRKLKENGASSVYYLDEKNQGLDKILSELGVIDGIFHAEKDVPDVDSCGEWHNLFYLFPDVSGETYLNFGELTPIKGKVGVCHRGARSTPRDEWRSIPVNKFKEITALPGYRFVSLCPDEEIPDACQVLSKASTYQDTIELLKTLELVITVDTSVAHLAGAMGIETWLLVSPPTDWRWGITGEKTRWYDSIRIYRATEHKNWEQVISSVIDDLAKRQQTK